MIIFEWLSLKLIIFFCFEVWESNFKDGETKLKKTACVRPLHQFFSSMWKTWSNRMKTLPKMWRKQTVLWKIVLEDHWHSITERWVCRRHLELREIYHRGIWMLQTGYCIGPRTQNYSGTSNNGHLCATATSWFAVSKKSPYRI